MKKVFIFGALIFSLSANFVFAQFSTLVPFGGRIILAPIPSAVCPDIDFAIEDPFAIIPVPVMPPSIPPIPGPFQQTTAPSNFVQFGRIIPGAWILGFYLPIPIPDCTVGVPPVVAPLPVFKAVQWGTSSPSLSI